MCILTFDCISVDISHIFIRKIRLICIPGIGIVAFLEAMYGPQMIYVVFMGIS